MKYRIVKLSQLSGNNASIYSVIVNDEQETVFDKFLKENRSSFLNEIKSILMRLNTIGSKTGARINFFKDAEGISGDGVCALYDEPNSNLRLYCIRYGTQIVILGGGGHKPKSIRALQEDEKLKEENYFLRWLSEEITKRVKEREIWYSNDYLEFLGDLEFEDYEND